MPSRRHAKMRLHAATRLSEEAIALIDKMAADASTPEDTVNRSEQMRRMLAFAALKMPKGWKPTTKNPGDIV